MLNTKAAIDFLNAHGKQVPRVQSNFRRFKQQEEEQQMFQNNFTKVYAGIMAKNKLLHQLKQQEKQQQHTTPPMNVKHNNRKQAAQQRPISGKPQGQQTPSTPYQVYQQQKRPVYQTPQYKNPRDRLNSAPNSVKPRVASARRTTMPPTPADPPLTYNQRFIVLTAAAQAVKQSRKQRQELCASNIRYYDPPRSTTYNIKKDKNGIIEFQFFDDRFEELNFSDLGLSCVNKPENQGALINKQQVKAEKQQTQQLTQSKIQNSQQQTLEKDKNIKQSQKQDLKNSQQKQTVKKEEQINIQNQAKILGKQDKITPVSSKMGQKIAPPQQQVQHACIDVINDDFDNTDTTQDNITPLNKQDNLVEIDYDKDDYTNYKQFRRNVRSGFADRRELTKVTIDIQEVLESNAKKNKLFQTKPIQNTNFIDLQENNSTMNGQVSSKNQNSVRQEANPQPKSINTGSNSQISKRAEYQELPLLQPNKEQIRQLAINTLELQNKMINNIQFQETSSYYYYDFD